MEYILHTIRWAKLAGCPCIDTTDDRFRPEGMTDLEALAHMKRIYLQLLRVAGRTLSRMTPAGRDAAECDDDRFLDLAVGATWRSASILYASGQPMRPRQLERERFG